MIVFDLKCGAAGHVFEAWFGSSEDYEAQKARGLVSCPLCGDGDIAKAVMAPQVAAKGNQSDAPSPAAMKKMLADMAGLQRRMLENSEHVGDRFPDEARAIHLGEAEARAIHGRASKEDAQSLAEDGIPVAPLPFPVVEPGEEN
jgi:hypothetical protein